MGEECKLFQIKVTAQMIADEEAMIRLVYFVSYGAVCQKVSGAARGKVRG